jgi:hypothetical protein
VLCVTAKSAARLPDWVIFDGDARRRKPIHVRSAPIATEFCAPQRMAVCAIRRPEQVQQTASLRGPGGFHNSRQPDREGRTTTGFALDGDVTAHHLTEASAYNEAEARPSVFASRR